MKILVTGSSGFIGKHLHIELAARGHQVIQFDRPECNVLNREQLAVACENAGAVVNLAGVLGTPELFGSETRAVQANILGALNVYDAARRAGIPVVQIGTGHKGQPNPYAITKACAEDLGLARAQWQGEKIAVVRAYHVYGPGQLPGPPHGTASVHKFFPTFACRALQGQPLEVCGGGDQLIDPVHVTDVARVLADAVDGPYGEVLEAGTGREISVRRVARDICWAAQSPSDIVDASPRPGEPERARVVAGKPLCEWHWPSQCWETVEWYREFLRG